MVSYASVSDIPGLIRKSAVCKICCTFTGEILTAITRDIIDARKTYREICDEYTKLLPPGVSSLNSMNIANHKKHCDPVSAALIQLERHGEPTTEGLALTAAYKAKYEETIDRAGVLLDLYRKRLKNVERLQKMLDKKDAEQEGLTEVQQSKKNALQSEIVSLTESIDDIQNSLQIILIKERDAKNGPAQVHITQNFVNIVQGGLRSFMDDIVQHIMFQIFPDQVEEGKKLVKYIGQSIDKHLVPSLQSTETVKAEVVN